MRACVKVEQVQHGQSVSVLIVIQHESDLVEEHLRFCLGDLFRILLLHDYSRLSADGFQDVLMGNVHFLAGDLVQAYQDRQYSWRV